MNDQTWHALIALGGVILVVGLASWLGRSKSTDGLGCRSRFFLTMLRLVIGWHFLVEGLDKLQSPTWTSEGYLREATGPLAPNFRELAGDRLAAMLTLGDDDTFPAELDLEWQSYLDAFAKFYELSEEEQGRAKNVVDQAKSSAVTAFKDKQPVQKMGPYPPPIVVEMTISERLEEYGKLQEIVVKIEEELPRKGEELFATYKSAKANLSKWRSELKRDLDAQTLRMKKALRDQILVELLKADLPKEMQGKVTPPKIDPAKDDPAKKEREWLTAVRSVYGQMQLSDAMQDVSPRAKSISRNAFEKKEGEKNQDDPLPITPRRPVRTWTMLDWSDAIVKYGLVAVGGCLLAGLFTRLACVVGAGFLFSFFLAMPPLPYWPEGPRVEGHYLYINKNIIEMFALLALATLPTGRWVGLDGLLQFLRPSRWRRTSTSGTVS